MAKHKISAKDIVDVIKKRWWVMLIELAVIAVILTLDLVSKEYAIRFLEAHDYFYEIMPGFINLTYVENSGAGFGMFSNNKALLIAFTFVLVIGVLAFLIVAQKQSEWVRVPLLFIAAGGIGNLVDRLAFGYVRDFIQYAFWEEFAVFNVADVFVTVGAFMLVVVLVVMLIVEGRKNSKQFKEEQAAKGGEPHELQDPLDAPVNLNPMLSSPNDYNFANDQKAEAPEKGAQNNDCTNCDTAAPANGEGNCERGDLNAEKSDVSRAQNSLNDDCAPENADGQYEAGNRDSADGLGETSTPTEE